MASAPAPVTPATQSEITINPDEHIYFTLLASKSPNKFSPPSFPATFGPEALKEKTNTPATPATPNNEYLMLDLAIMKDKIYYELTEKVNKFTSNDNREKLKLFLEWILPGRYWRCAALLRNGGPTNTSEHEALQRQMLEIQDQVTLIEKALTSSAAPSAPTAPTAPPTSAQAPAPAPAPDPAPSAEKWAIMLDFDGTITVNHSRGTNFKEGPTEPMDSTNKQKFKENIKKWLKAGHSIAIITRAIGELIQPYLTTILNTVDIKINLNNYEEGTLSLYAPTNTVFNENKSRDHSTLLFWANWKVDRAVEFLNACNIKNIIFMDDTKENVFKMKERLNNEIKDIKGFEISAVTSNVNPYESTFEAVNNIIPKPAT